MADVAKKMYLGQPGTSIGNVYGPTAAAKAIIQSVHVCNTTAAQATISISIGSTGVDTAATRILDALPVEPHAAVDMSTFTVLESGEYITAKQGTVNALTLTISGVEL